MKMNRNEELNSLTINISPVVASWKRNMDVWKIKSFCL